MSIFENTVMVHAGRSAMGKALIGLCAAALVVCVGAALYINPIFFLIGVAPILGLWALIKYGDLEYEYTWIEGQMDIDRIYGKSLRKSVAKIDAEDLLLIAPLGAGELHNYERENAGHKDCSGNDPNVKKYKVVYKVGEHVKLVTFQPDQNFLDMVRVRNGRKVIL